jgi:hypothetical protein
MRRLRGVLFLACAGCTKSPATNEAIFWGSQAGTAQLAKSAEENERRRQPPRPQPCGDYDHPSTCYQGPIQDTGGRVVPGMTLTEARSYTLRYINGLRSLNGREPLTLDDRLTEFAQQGSEQLSRDHRPHGHIIDEQGKCPGCSENQGDSYGWRPAPLQKQIDEILAGMMAEGTGGGHHDNILRPEWRKLGVGIVYPEGRLFFTTDFTP